MWLTLAVCVPRMSPPVLMVLCGALGVAALASTEVVKALRRVRWLFISIICVYAFTQTSAPSGDSYFVGASGDGLLRGLEQAARLALLIGALVWLFPKSARAELLYAIYLILIPLRIIRVDAERVAIRLALTMHLALEAPRGSLAALLLPDSQASVPATISLPRSSFGALDIALVAALMIAIVSLW